MRLLSCFLFSLSFLSLSVYAVDNLDKANFPSCALECWNTQLMTLGCLSTDTNCTCSAAVKTEVVACAAASTGTCNITETYRTMGIVDEFCGVKSVKGRQRRVQFTVYIALPITLLFIVLRFYSRGTLDVDIGIDDWLILVSGVLLIGISNSILHLAGLGFGQHTWYLSSTQMTDIFEWFYIGEAIYIGAITFTKLSLLFFFRRIFPNETLGRATIFLMIFVVLSNIIVVSTLIFQCIPIKGVWINWMYDTPPTKCLNSFAAVIAAAIVSILHDIFILAAPLPTLWALNLNTSKKLNLLAMFSVGIFVVICSLIRIPTLLSLEATSDPSYDEADIGVWTFLEIAVGIVCACLPATRSLFSSIFPAFKMSLVSKSGEDGIGSTYAMSKQKRSQIRRIDSQASFFELSEHDQEYRRKSNANGSVEAAENSLYSTGSKDDKEAFNDSLRPQKDGNVMSRIAASEYNGGCDGSDRKGGITVTRSIDQSSRNG